MAVILWGGNYAPAVLCVLIQKAYLNLMKQLDKSCHGYSTKIKKNFSSSPCKLIKHTVYRPVYTHGVRPNIP